LFSFWSETFILQHCYTHADTIYLLGVPELWCQDSQSLLLINPNLACSFGENVYLAFSFCLSSVRLLSYFVYIFKALSVSSLSLHLSIAILDKEDFQLFSRHLASSPQSIIIIISYEHNDSHTRMLHSALLRISSYESIRIVFPTTPHWKIFVPSLTIEVFKLPCLVSFCRYRMPS